MYHRQSIECWLRNEIFAINLPGRWSSEVSLDLLASATLVDFPQFRDIYHLIPRILDRTLKDRQIRQVDYHRIEDSDKWDIYVNYRQIVSRFLIDQTCGIPRDTHDNPSSLFSAWSRRGQENYVYLAKYLLWFLSELEGLYE